MSKPRSSLRRDVRVGPDLEARRADARDSPHWELFARQYDPPRRVPGICWVAELRDSTGFCTRPSAVAYLTDYRGSPIPPFDAVLLDFIFVPDDLRRVGFATRLIRECRYRWPELTLTEAIGEPGERLIASLQRGGWPIQVLGDPAR